MCGLSIVPILLLFIYISIAFAVIVVLSSSACLPALDSDTEALAQSPNDDDEAASTMLLESNGEFLQ